MVHMDQQLLKSILREVESERTRYVVKSGLDHDDTRRCPLMTLSLISYEATNWMPAREGEMTSEIVDSFRDSMIKVAALATGAIESLDRQRKKNENAFYEQAKIVTRTRRQAERADKPKSAELLRIEAGRTGRSKIPG